MTARKRKQSRLKKVDINVMITKIQKLEDSLSESLKDNYSHNTVHIKPDKDAIDLLALFVQSLHDIEALDPESFALVSLFDLTEPASYEAAMLGPYAAEWSKSAFEEYDSLIANDTWELVRAEDVESEHTILSEK